MILYNKVLNSKGLVLLEFPFTIELFAGELHDASRKYSERRKQP
jgi:hypothetical protein